MGRPRVQGFRRALPRGVPARDFVRGAGAHADHPRRDFGRHRRRGRGGVPSASGHRGRRAVSRRASSRRDRSSSSTCWGDNVHGLRGARHVRRLPADGEGGVPRSGAAQRVTSCHRRTASTSAGCCRRWSTTPREPRDLAQERRSDPRFIIPTGNLGNAVACVWARHARVADRRDRARDQRATAPDRLPRDRRWQPRASVATLASAMDVGNPSNMERLHRPASDRGRPASGRVGGFHR